MIDIARKIRVLGIIGSPRKNANSQYLLETAFQVISDKYKDLIEIEKYSVSGKKFSPCISCFQCSGKKSLGECVIRDDFQELRDLWLVADVVIYSVPVYHLSIPGQLKCFLDRLGNTLNRRYISSSPRFLKIVGSIAQGTHFGAGQESTINYLAQHALMKNCIPVSGDGWQSYLGACGWTANKKERHAIENLSKNGDKDALVAIEASISLCKRAVELALIIHFGGRDLCHFLIPDVAYKPFLTNLDFSEAVEVGQNEIE